MQTQNANLVIISVKYFTKVEFVATVKLFLFQIYP